MIFRALINGGMLSYMDDVIILAVVAVVETIKSLKMMLDLASEYGLEINLKKKSQFLKEHIEFLGHIIKEGNLSLCPKNTNGVSNFPGPKNTKQIQSYLGLTDFFLNLCLNIQSWTGC